MTTKWSLIKNGETIPDGTWSVLSGYRPDIDQWVYNFTIDEDPAELEAEAKQRAEAEALAEAERREAGNSTLAGVPLYKLSRLELIQAVRFLINNPWLFSVVPSVTDFGNSNYQIKRKKEYE